MFKNNTKHSKASRSSRKNEKSFSGRGNSRRKREGSHISSSSIADDSHELKGDQQRRLGLHRPPVDVNDLISIKDFELEARRRTKKTVFDYYYSGSDDMKTLEWNVEDFSKIRVKPRILRDVSKVHVETELFGCRLKMPLIIAPSAMHLMAHPDGEIGSCKAAQEFGSAFCLSSLATTSIQELRESDPNAQLYFQLYVMKDREITKNLVINAEKNNYKAIFVTVDAPRLGNREPDHRNKFHLPDGLRLKNLESDLEEKNTESALNRYFKDQIDASLTWDDIKWLKSITRLPIVLKGIQCSEDAIIAADLGVEGIVISNHGARQLDTAVSTIEILPEIVQSVRSNPKNSNMKILIDGGIRRGSSIMKCLALGADCVLVARPILWGLCVDGKKGVRRVLDILYDEFILSMQLTGAHNLETLQKYGKDLFIFKPNIPPKSFLQSKL